MNIRNRAGNKYRKFKLLYFFIKEYIVKKKREGRHLTKKLLRIYKEINISCIQHAYIYFPLNKKKIYIQITITKKFQSNQINSTFPRHLFNKCLFTPQNHTLQIISRLLLRSIKNLFLQNYFHTRIYFLRNEITPELNGGPKRYLTDIRKPFAGMKYHGIRMTLREARDETRGDGGNSIFLRHLKARKARA